MKIKFYLPLNILLIFFCFSAVGQTMYFGVEGGFSSRNLTNGATLPQLVTSGNHLVLTPEAGIFTEMKFSGLFSLQPMMEYSPQGSKNGAFIADVNTTGQPSPNNNRAELNYLLIPVLAKFGWNFENAPVRLYMAAGPFAGVLLSAKQTIFDSTPGADNGQDVKPKLHNFNAGLEGKAGFMFFMGQGSLFVEGGANYGVIKTQKAAVSSGGNTGSLTFSVGYIFWLGSNFRTSSNPNGR